MSEKQITLSNGIVLRVKPMPPLLLNAIANSIPEPEVPMWWNEDDQRHEANPNHPEYQKALADRNATIGMRIIDATLSVGTELVAVPGTMIPPESDSWIRRLKLTGQDATFNPEDKEERYLAWLRLYAIETNADLEKVNSIPMQLAGLQEEEVAEAMELFPSGKTRGEDNGVSVENGVRNGHNVQPVAPRTRTRNRRT